MNRYVDLTEAIDTNHASFMDNADFQEADAVPLNGPLPESHYLEDEVRDIDACVWVPDDLCFFIHSWTGYARGCPHMGIVRGDGLEY